MRPLLVDSFMANDEFDILQMRLEVLYEVVDFFICVESDVDHQDHGKPFHISDNLDRFTEWKDKLVVVKATGLPTREEHPDPWAREIAQREHVVIGLAEIGCPPDAVVMHGDIDEIPSVLAARNVRPRGAVVSFHQRGHFWAVDWLYPPGWRGTVAAEARTIGRFGDLRNTRNLNPIAIPDAGWHFSWLGGAERAMKKVGSFCHPEVEERVLAGLKTDKFYREGFHLDKDQYGQLTKMVPVDVDGSWPAFIRERRCPESWWRPR